MVWPQVGAGENPKDVPGSSCTGISTKDTEVSDFCLWSSEQAVRTGTLGALVMGLKLLRGPDYHVSGVLLCDEWWLQKLGELVLLREGHIAPG